MNPISKRLMIEPDRKNGQIISDNSSSASIQEFLAVVSTISIILYSYLFHNSSEYRWWGWAIAMVILYLLSNDILRRTFTPLIEKLHQRPAKRKYYFRSGKAVCKQRYDQFERDELVTKQKEVPVSFVAFEERGAQKYYWRYKNRTWIAEKEASADEIEAAIKDYLK